MASLDYLAGYFDADGSIAITRSRNKNGHFIHQIKATVVCVSPKIPFLYHEKWGGSLIVSDAQHKKNPKARIRVDWTTSSKGCKLFLMDVMPFLIFRKEQAEVAIEMQNHLDQFRGGIKPWDDNYEKVMQYRYDLYRKIRDMKAVHYLERYRDVGEFGEKLTASKGRVGRPRAKQDSYSRLTLEHVAEIRASKGTVRQVDLADKFGISQSQVSRIQLSRRV